MPELDFGDWPDVITAVPGYRILSTMIYPKEKAKREELHAALVAEYVLCSVDAPGAFSSMPSSEGLLALLRARHKGEAYKQVIDAAKPACMRGSIAGDVLGLIRWLTAGGHYESVLKACSIQTDIVKRATSLGTTARTLGLVTIPYRNPNALLTKAWSPYRSVAHLWTAHNAMISGYAEEDAKGYTHLPHLQWFQDTEFFLEFLAIAENFRKFGEDHCSTRSREPTLNRRATWRVPREIQLPELSPYNPPQLPAVYMAALESYHAKPSALF